METTYDHYFEKQTLKNYETSINAIQNLIKVYNSRMQKSEGVETIVAYGNSIAQLQGAALLLRAEGNFIQSEIKKADELKYAPKKIHTGYYMSTYDFVGGNDLESLAVILFGQNWEAADDVEQIQSLCNSVSPDTYNVECIHQISSEKDIRVTLK